MTDQNEQETDRTVLEIPPPDFLIESSVLSQYTVMNIEMDEPFKDVCCFQDIFRASTFFRLKYKKSFLTIIPENCEPIVESTNSITKTLAMSFSSSREPAFITYKKQRHQITVFSPEVADPIGRIVRKDGLYRCDIFSLATDEKFTMKMIHHDFSPAAMCIQDTNGTMVAFAQVSASTKRKQGILSQMYLDEFAFEVIDGLSHATRVILLVSFVNWTKLANQQISDQNNRKSAIVDCIAVCYAFFLFALLLAAFLFIGHK